LRPSQIERNGRDMLREFIVSNGELIIERARQRVRKRMPGLSSEARLEHGIPIFLSQLSDALDEATSPGALHVVNADGNPQQRIDESAALHGRELLRNGFTIGQVVHGYGDVCQVVTELAVETNAAIGAADFHVFNLCLDDAIAGAVTAYGDQREADLTSESTQRKGVLAHELRNQLHAAVLSFDVIQRGAVGLRGSTGAVHARSLAGLRTLVERSLAEVRLEAGPPRFQRLVMAEFIEEIALVAQMEADGFGLELSVSPVDPGLAVEADRQLLGSAVSNLLQNAFKFTHSRGNVSLLTHATSDRVLIEIWDACGGLPDGKAEALFLPYTQAGVDRSGLGLGLSIALTAVRVNSGDISVRNIPGKGCVFIIDLPRKPLPPRASQPGPPHGDRGAPDASGNGSKSRPHSREPKSRTS